MVESRSRSGDFSLAVRLSLAVSWCRDLLHLEAFDGGMRLIVREAGDRGYFVASIWSVVSRIICRRLARTAMTSSWASVS